MANGTFGYTVASNASYLSLSQTTGQLVAPGALDSSDHRITLAVDWASAPPGSTTVALTVASANNQSIATIYVPVQNDQTPSNLTAGTFVASNGALSIEAEHYAPMANATVPINNVTMTNATTPFYVVLPDYGRTLSGVTLYPYNCAPQDPSTAPYLTYPFYTAQAATNVNITVYIGPGMNIDAKNPMRWAVAVDQMAPIVVQPVYDYVIGPPVSTWQMPIEGIWTNGTIVGDVGAGQHELKMWALDAGLVLEKIVMDLGGLQSSYLGPPESMRV
ncbi:hypothetical protein B0A55_12332 [Friedmanniomyces simplex]|uniref:Gylcosyl hydrolase 115 C-terminal domain-containing protein n=1 Tax=Friedmanniomyces simplex TaxID=329884 RepID=A0A4U0W4L7_9PEZI|nr:hypothetical protein B0A55_12332 [Friedmanniomyces simplex]